MKNKKVYTISDRITWHPLFGVELTPAGLEPAVLTVILRGWHPLFMLTEDLQGQNLTCRPLRQRSKEGSVVETKIIITNYLYN